MRRKQHRQPQTKMWQKARKPKMVRNNGHQPVNRVQQKQVMPPVLSWRGVMEEVQKLAARHHVDDKIYGISGGGHIVALMLASVTNAGLPEDRPPLQDGDSPDAWLIVTDWLDQTGNALYKWKRAGFEVDALFRHRDAPSGLAPHATVIMGQLIPPWAINLSPPEPNIIPAGNIIMPPQRG